MKLLARSIGISIILAFLSGADAVGAKEPGVKRVLILHSFGRNFAPFNAASSAFRTELARQSAAPLEFLEASLETARYEGDDADGPFVEYLRALFAPRPADLLVPFGAPPDGIEPILLGSAMPVYDSRELKRWRISEGRLLPGSIARVKEPTIWEQYRGHLIAVLALVAVQAGLIGGLLLERARRRRAVIDLHESEERFRLLADAAPVMIWMSGTDKLCTYFQ